MSEPYTDKQIAEIESVVLQAIAITYEKRNSEDVVKEVIAALTARKLRDDCPVIFSYNRTGKPFGICRASGLAEDAMNIRALIPEDTIIQKAKERDEYLKEFGGHRIHSDKTYWTRVIDECKYGTNE